MLNLFLLSFESDHGISPLMLIFVMAFIFAVIFIPLMLYKKWRNNKNASKNAGKGNR